MELSEHKSIICILLLLSIIVLVCPIDMPICASASANYHQHNDLLISRYDLERIKLFAIDSANKGAACFSFKCSTKDIYRKTIEHLFDVDADAFKVIKESAKRNKAINGLKYTYSCNADLFTINIYFVYKSKK